MLCEFHEDLLPDLLYLLSPRDIINLSLSCKHLYEYTKVYNRIYKMKYFKLLTHLNSYELNFILKNNDYLNFQIIEQLVFNNTITKFTISSNGNAFEIISSFNNIIEKNNEVFTCEQKIMFQNFGDLKDFLCNSVLSHNQISKNILFCKNVKNQSIFVSDV